MTIDLTSIRPYGDTHNDGIIQLSFTLPVPCGARAVKAAETLLINMGLKEPHIVHEKDMGEGFTFFIAYAKTTHVVNYEGVHVEEVTAEAMGRDEIDVLIKKEFKRKLVIVGACTGDDAHTVGIDAIINMKGIGGHYGLERYTGFESYNLGSQVRNEDMIMKAREFNADAILISQIVTQKESHIHNLTNFIELAEAEGVRDKMLLIIGGPRITHELALELGFDAGFGRNTYPEQVASFVVQKLIERKA